MEFGNGRIIYDGVQDTFNGKVAFMENIIRYPVVQRDVARHVMENQALREKIGYTKTRIGNQACARLEMAEDAFEMVFDSMVGKKAGERLKEADPLLYEFGQPMLEGAVEIHLDATYLIVYGMVINPKCRQALKAEITNPNEYYSYWEKSKYNNPKFESYIPSEYIWDSRVLSGMLEKLRSEEERGETYRQFMRILYAGNGYLKRQIKGRRFLYSDDVKPIIQREMKEKKNMLPFMSLTMLVLVMAEDMDIIIIWDYVMILFLGFFQNWQEEIEKCEREEALQDTSRQKMNYEDFFTRFDEKYDVHLSMSELVCSSKAGEVGQLLCDVMNIFSVDPRKFLECELTEEECHQILDKGEQWSLKKYWYMHIIAQFSKYIYQLEQKYLRESKSFQEQQNWKIEQEQCRIANKEKQWELEQKRLNREKKQLEETILKQELQIAKLTKTLEEKEGKIQQNAQELSNLRTYVYLMSKEEDEEVLPKQTEEETIAWKNRRVVVVGGHVNWQNKLKELFPKWHFVAAGQNCWDGEVIKGKDFIICNTEILNHACYYKVIAQKSKAQQLLYVHSNNIQRFLMELEAQMK